MWDLSMLLCVLWDLSAILCTCHILGGPVDLRVFLDLRDLSSATRQENIGLDPRPIKVWLLLPVFGVHILKTEKQKGRGFEPHPCHRSCALGKGTLHDFPHFTQPHGDYITTHGDYIITRTEAWRTPSCIKLTKGYATS
ncbi:hypothetical protein Bbelb_266910 [Branchiostoma belcheri]|nr:hypothetical protein Bbelb_266910 [Branchiostoma belcheri]